MLHVIRNQAQAKAIEIWDDVSTQPSEAKDKSALDAAVDNATSSALLPGVELDVPVVAWLAAETVRSIACNKGCAFLCSVAARTELAITAAGQAAAQAAVSRGTYPATGSAMDHVATLAAQSVIDEGGNETHAGKAAAAGATLYGLQNSQTVQRIVMGASDAAVAQGMDEEDAAVEALKGAHAKAHEEAEGLVGQGGTQEEAAEKAAEVMTEAVALLGRSPTGASHEAVKAFRENGGLDAEFFRVAGIAATEAGVAREMTMAEISDATYQAVKFFEGSNDDAWKAAGEAVIRAGCMNNRNVTDVVEMAKGIAENGNFSTEHTVQLVRDAGARAAIRREYSIPDVAQAAANATELVQGTDADAVAAAEFAATMAACDSFYTLQPDQAGAAVKDAVAANGGTQQEAIEAAGRGAAEASIKANRVGLQVGQDASQAVHAAGGSREDCEIAAGAGTRKAAEKKGNYNEAQISELVAEAEQELCGQNADALCCAEVTTTLAASR